MKKAICFPPYVTTPPERYNRTAIAEGSGDQRLSSSRRSNEQNTSRRLDRKLLKHFRIEQREQNHLLEGVHVVFETSHAVPGNRGIHSHRRGIRPQHISLIGFVLDAHVHGTYGVEKLLVTTFLRACEGCFIRGGGRRRRVAAAVEVASMASIAIVRVRFRFIPVSVLHRFTGREN